MLVRADRLVLALVDLVREAGGQLEIAEMQGVLTAAEEAARPGGARDLSPHEVFRIRLTKAIARATPPEVYRDRARRQRLRRAVSDLLVAHGVPRDALRLG